MAGFFGNLFGGSSANTGGLERKQQGLLDQQNQLYGSLLSNYQAAAAGGAYDPNRQLEQLQKDNTYASGISAGNAAASARTLGYRPGDSEPLLRQAAQSRAAELAYDQQANAIRADAYNRGANALGQVAQVGGGLLSSGINGYGNLISQRIQQAQQPSGFASLLGAVTPFIPGVGAAGSLLGGASKSAGSPSAFSLPANYFSTTAGGYGRQPNDLYADPRYAG